MITTDLTKFYIDGSWVKATGNNKFITINPATNKPSGSIMLATKKDVDIAVASAKKAFAEFSSSDINYRKDILKKIIALYEKRIPDLEQAVTLEMGAPTTIAHRDQVPVGLNNLKNTLKALDEFNFIEKHDHYYITKEAVGVCGLITPWNWPINQVTLKIAPAIATGCTMVLKPSEYASFSAQIIAEIIMESGLPAGVFNMLYGLGEDVGNAIIHHPDLDHISFTGSLNVGKLITNASSATLKRLTLELGGKSANIILPDANVEQAVADGVKTMMLNTGQSCSAPSRMLVHKNMYQKAIEVAKNTAETIVVGDPTDANTQVGPLVNQKQWQRVRDYITIGINEGATVVTGGLETTGLNLTAENQHGYFVAPTIFANVNNQMRIAQEEIFGPVLCMIPYDNVDDAIDIANDNIYGLVAYIYTQNTEEAKTHLIPKLRAGQVYINGKKPRHDAPFGGYKQSGVGRENGKYGLEGFTEIKAVIL